MGAGDVELPTSSAPVLFWAFSFVMPGLPRLLFRYCSKDVDGRDKPGHDE
jgi:hypothetical protein